MSCGKEHQTGYCVCDTLLEISRRQRPADTLGGCEESLRELSGKFTNNFNTIPLQLIIARNPNTNVAGTSGTVFIARGFRRFPNGNGNGTLLTATSTWFRVNSVDRENCCAELELLTSTIAAPAPGGVTPELVAVPDVSFDRTGITVTVDLKCFCGVVCLPAVNAQLAPLPEI